MLDLLNRRNYLWWIAISAMLPVVETIGSTAFGWGVGDVITRAPACLRVALTFPFLYFFTIPLWQYLALRRFATRLALGYWYGIAILTFFGYFAFIFILAPTALAKRFTIDPQINPACAAFMNRDMLPGILAEATHAQSFSLMASYIAIFVVLPTAALSIKSDIPWRDLFAARLVASGAAVFVPILTVKLVGHAYPLAQWQSHATLFTFVNIATIRAITGAIEGAVACIVLATLASLRDKRIKKLEAIELLIWLILGLQLWICLNVRT